MFPVWCQTLLFIGMSTATNLKGLRGLNEKDANAIEEIYANARAQLGLKERKFLEEVLAADDLIMERNKRGIVDQILAAISGVSGLSNGIIGGGAPAPAPAAATMPQSAALPPIISNTQALTAQQQVVLQQLLLQQQQQQQQQQTQPQQPITTQNPVNNDNHLFSQISKVVINSATRNITGIVDEALKIGTPAPVRDLVNGIVGAAYCNGIRRLLGRC